MARVELGKTARRDLAALGRMIEAEGGRNRAAAYRARLLRTLRTLETFPFGGRERPELGPGIHSLGFEKRALILFRPGREVVLVLRILYAGRQP